jgi:predicted NAD/FAD-binding protein
MRIAIIGAGVSGLVCAHLLHREHEIVVFEAGDYAGGHTNTIDVETDGGVYAVDTGFIVFNDRNYPHFQALLAELGVATQPSQMSFGVSDGADFEYNSVSPNGLFARRSHLVDPRFHRMLADVVRFTRDGRELLRSDADPSLREWLHERRYSPQFVEQLIVPQAAAVWSADPQQMWSFPARFLLEFFDNHGMFELRGRPQWRTVTGGSRAYVEALTWPWRSSLRLRTPVARVRRLPDRRVEVTPHAAGNEPEVFDAVVIATHSDQALSMLADPADRERELLGAIPYQRNEAVLHTDTSLLPRRRRAWASWNYHLDQNPAGPSTVTYHMNRLQSLTAPQEFCVTLNRSSAIDPDKIIRTIEYAHPVFTRAGVAAQQPRHVLNRDCRDLTGHYDKLVSIEMVEAVGWRDFDTFFARCSELLHPEGAMLLQAITIDDRAYEVEKASPSFIRTYIFPGGALPSLEVIARCLARETDMRMVGLQDLTPHYPETLRRWRANIDGAADRLERLGYDEPFRRLWRMYLAYREAGFAERRIGVVQAHLAKPAWRRALYDGASALSSARSAGSAGFAGSARSAGAAASAAAAPDSTAIPISSTFAAGSNSAVTPNNPIAG